MKKIDLKKILSFLGKKETPDRLLNIAISVTIILAFVVFLGLLWVVML